MQGRYGSLWIDRWRTGQIEKDGTDAGVNNAMAMWAEDLAGFADTPQAIKSALAACAHLKLPPTLPEFADLCRDAAKRIRDDVPKLAHTLSPEEREHQKEMAQKVSKAINRPPSFDGMAWARHPRSQHAATAIHREVAGGNRLLAPVFEDLVAAGIVTAEGKLLKRWDGVGFVKP